MVILSVDTVYFVDWLGMEFEKRLVGPHKEGVEHLDQRDKVVVPNCSQDMADLTLLQCFETSNKI